MDRAGAWTPDPTFSDLGQKNCPSLSRTTCLVIPSILTCFRECVAPEMTCTEAAGTPRTRLRDSMTSRFALPWTGGDLTEQRRLFLQGS